MKERILNNINTLIVIVGLTISMMGIFFGVINNYCVILFVGVMLLIATLIHFNWSSKRFNGVYFKSEVKE